MGRPAIPDLGRPWRCVRVRKDPATSVPTGRVVGALPSRLQRLAYIQMNYTRAQISLEQRVHGRVDES